MNANSPSRIDDLKAAVALSLCFAIAAALSVPLLLPSLPPEARQLPLPIPVFSVILAVQMAILYGLFAFCGIRLARAGEREPAPLLTSIFAGSARPPLAAFNAG